MERQNTFIRNKIWSEINENYFFELKPNVENLTETIGTLETMCREGKLVRADQLNADFEHPHRIYFESKYDK